MKRLLQNQDDKEMDMDKNY